MVAAIFDPGYGGYGYNVWMKSESGEYTRLLCRNGYADVRDALGDMELHALRLVSPVRRQPKGRPG